MPKTRIEAFTDAVIAIVLTLLVLDLREPHGDTWRAFEGTGHQFFIYLISFASLAVYWNNHHHLFNIVKKVDGRVLWANNLFILMMSLFPFATDWVMDYPVSLAPQLLYGLVILGADISYLLLGFALVKVNGTQSPVGHLFHRYRKMYRTLILNVLALLLGWLIHPVAVLVVNGLMLLMWVIPEKRIETWLHYGGKD
ncbi:MULTISPECIES: TMEM175 family protein [Enterococcus]|uniref:DUF1211 domain-containing protein n=1 Tax=Enterococcus diestrammenae TaxID=1155073 RepID=A0ABV0F0Y1_9ENTE|nr:TMEM175 family protein [Enterococcus diestrammenae]KAF1299016.1 hypothetical protein BAU18_05245 [Enterococcus diestrammenae]HIX69679.1 DUF1211 domain-containing protein [Candidatus Enterococcus stercoravium]